jgi:hypothetical protein
LFLVKKILFYYYFDTGKQIEGVWHTGIVVFGQEWFFGGGGIQSCPPCGTIMGQPDEKKLQVAWILFWKVFLGYLY